MRLLLRAAAILGIPTVAMAIPAVDTAIQQAVVPAVAATAVPSECEVCRNRRGDLRVPGRDRPEGKVPIKSIGEGRDRVRGNAQSDRVRGNAQSDRGPGHEERIGDTTDDRTSRDREVDHGGKTGHDPGLDPGPKTGKMNAYQLIVHVYGTRKEY